MHLLVLLKIAPAKKKSITGATCERPVMAPAAAVLRAVTAKRHGPLRVAIGRSEWLVLQQIRLVPAAAAAAVASVA